jgi:hypothetical protein
MDRRQEQVNEAAEKFADAIRESYRAVADRTVSAQERSAELTQRFFDGVISNLRIQAENNLEATRSWPTNSGVRRRLRRRSRRSPSAPTWTS